MEADKMTVKEFKALLDVIEQIADADASIKEIKQYITDNNFNDRELAYKCLDGALI